MTGLDLNKSAHSVGTKLALAMRTFFSYVIFCGYVVGVLVVSLGLAGGLWTMTERIWPGVLWGKLGVLGSGLLTGVVAVRIGRSQILGKKSENGEAPDPPTLATEATKAPHAKKTTVENQAGNRAARGLDELYADSFGNDSAGVSVEVLMLGDDLPAQRVWRSGDQIHSGNIVLENKLVYSSPLERDSCPGTICLGQPAAPKGEIFDEPLHYWPSYADLSPRGRRGLLLWIADGARSTEVSVSYVFLYFYGLEQRAIGDRADLARIRHEVLRLHDLFGEHRSFHSYASALVGMTHVLDGEDPHPSMERLRVRSGKKLPLTFLRMISASWPGGTWPVPYLLELLKYEGSNTIVQKRVWPKFRELFEMRFAEKFPLGLAPRKNAKRHRAPYHWAAHTGRVHVEYEYVEASSLGTCWRDLLALWTEVTAELRPYALAIGRESLSEGALYDRLPDELKSGDHPEQAAWLEWFEGHADSEERCVSTWGQLAKLSPSINPKDGKLTPKSLREAAALCDSVGLCLEPDPRAGTQKSQPLDEAVLLYRPSSGVPAPPDEYHDALSLMVELSVGIAEADGEVDESEVERILGHVDRQDALGEAERERLLACVAFFHATGAGLKRATKGRLGKLPEEVREMIAQLVVLVALADDVVTPAEEKGLAKVYRALGLPPTRLDEILHPHREQEEPASREPKQSAALVIDWDRVNAVTANTREVHALLHEALASGEEGGEPNEEAPTGVPDPDPTPSQPPQATPVPLGLDERAAPLVAWIRELDTDTIASEAWSERCRSAGLMACQGPPDRSHPSSAMRSHLAKPVSGWHRGRHRVGTEA